MAAFDRILSGIPEMDAAFDNIRLGDNVVWRVSDLSKFRLFMEPYVEQAIRDHRDIIYFRFANHEPLITGRPEVRTVELPLSHRFETFTVDIHNVIEQAGYNPELSYGSHIFQDLVEAEILYTAVFHSEKTIHYAPEKLKNCPDITGQFDDGEELSEIVHVYDVSSRQCEVYHDVAGEHLLITLKG